MLQVDFLDAPAHGYRRRARRLMWLVAFVFAALIGRLAELQLVDGPALREASKRNYVRRVAVRADRGRIMDRSGRVLAYNRPSFDIYVTPAYVRSPDALLDGLREVLELDALDIERLRDRLAEPRGMWRFRPVRVRRDISRRQVARIEALRASHDGLEIRVDHQRTYPESTIGSHLLGYMGRPTAEELRAAVPRRYTADSMLGRFGLERRLENDLAGYDGFEQFVADARGGRLPDSHPLSFLAGGRKGMPAEPGNDVVLTLDQDVQRILVRALRNYESGAAVVVDPADGDVLGIISKPDFDPNIWSGRLTGEAKRVVDENPYNPMLDKSVQSYFPGSVYKVVTALAALEEGVVTADELVESPGHYEFGNRVFHCHNRSGHGTIDLSTALAASADVYFYKLGERLGIDTLAVYARRFGFGERTGLGINGESSGLVPTRSWHEQHSADGYQYGLALSTAIGQGDVRATPLQVAMAYAALANGGTLYEPRIVERVQTLDGTVVRRVEPRITRSLTDDVEHLRILHDGLERAVMDGERGTGTAAAVRVGRVAGKSGTAQVRDIDRGRFRQRVKRFRDRDHAWFAAYAPAESPRVAVVVFLEHGGAGGRDAAPVVREILERYHEEITPLFTMQASSSRRRARVQ